MRRERLFEHISPNSSAVKRHHQKNVEVDSQSSSQNMAHHKLLQLQQTHGNQYVARLVQRLRKDSAEQSSDVQRKPHHKAKELSLDEAIGLFYGGAGVTYGPAREIRDDGKKAENKAAAAPIAPAAAVPKAPKAAGAKKKGGPNDKGVGATELLDMFFKAVKSGGITVALYVRQGYELKKAGKGEDGKPIYKKEPVSGATEFLSQAQQFALDHATVGLVGDKAQIGVPMEITGDISATLTKLMEQIDTLVKAHPRASELEGIAVKIKSLNIFTHGYEHGLLAAADDDVAQWVSGTAEGWAKALAPFISNQNPNLVFYACRTAGDPAKKSFSKQDMQVDFAKEQKAFIDQMNALPPPKNKKEAAERRKLMAAGARGGLPFAERVRLTIEKEKAKAGIKKFHVTTYGHLDAGHTSANNRLAEFYGGIRTSLLHRVAEQYLKQVYAGTDQGSKSLTNTQIDSAASEMLNVLREEEVEKSGKNKGKFVRGKDGKIKYITGKDEPSAVYIREIPFMGLDRAIKTLTDKDEPAKSSLDDLPLTEPSKLRVYKGLLILRKRFADKVISGRSKLPQANGK